MQLVICCMLEKLFYEDRVNFRHRLEPSAKDYRLQKQLQKLVLNHFADQVVPAVENLRALPNAQKLWSKQILKQLSTCIRVPYRNYEWIDTGFDDVSINMLTLVLGSFQLDFVIQLIGFFK